MVHVCNSHSASHAMSSLSCYFPDNSHQAVLHTRYSLSFFGWNFPKSSTCSHFPTFAYAMPSRVHKFAALQHNQIHDWIVLSLCPEHNDLGFLVIYILNQDHRFLSGLKEFVFNHNEVQTLPHNHISIPGVLVKPWV